MAFFLIDGKFGTRLVPENFYGKTCPLPNQNLPVARLGK